MALFNKPNQQTNHPANATIISSSTKVKGTISSSCALHIDGAHEGSIHVKGGVTIGKSGKIEGDVSADKLAITGLFQGTADCEHVEILAGGTLRGKVISNNLTIDQNCTFEGESVNKTQAGAQKKLDATKKTQNLNSLPNHVA